MERVVYRAYPGRNLNHVVHLLRKNGLTPIVLDQPSPDETLQYSSGYSYRVRVAVPEEQVPRALELLAEWESESSKALRGHLKPLRRQVLKSMLIGLPVAGAFWAFMVFTEREPSLLVAVAGFVLGSVLAFAFLGLRQQSPRAHEDADKDER